MSLGSRLRVVVGVAHEEHTRTANHARRTADITKIQSSYHTHHGPRASSYDIAMITNYTKRQNGQSAMGLPVNVLFDFSAR